jgi:hypothetical protein
MRGKVVLLPKQILTILLYGVLKLGQSILVGLAKVCTALAPIMQFYFYRIDRNNRCKMFKGTWLFALERIDRSPRILHFEIHRMLAPE